MRNISNILPYLAASAAGTSCSLEAKVFQARCFHAANNSADWSCRLSLTKGFEWWRVNCESSWWRGAGKTKNAFLKKCLNNCCNLFGDRVETQVSRHTSHWANQISYTLRKGSSNAEYSKPNPSHTCYANAPGVALKMNFTECIQVRKHTGCVLGRSNLLYLTCSNSSLWKFQCVELVVATKGTITFFGLNLQQFWNLFTLYVSIKKKRINNNK